MLGYIHYKVEEVPWLLMLLFHLGEEDNISARFSSFLLLNVSFFLFLKFQIAQLFKNHWLLVSLGFLLLSLDEVAGLRETLNTAIDLNCVYPASVLLFVIYFFSFPLCCLCPSFIFGFLI